MARITVEKRGKVYIPEAYLDRCSLREGDEVYVWFSENGLTVKFPRFDVRRICIETTSLCNINCVMCVRNAWSDDTGYMDMDTFYTIVRQLKALPSIQGINLAGFGEPLYHPEVLRIVQAIKNLGLELVISTNGTLLDSDMAEELIHAGVDRIVVSLDSCKPKLFSDIRAGANLDAVISNIKRLNEIKQRQQSRYPDIGIEFVAMRRNIHELADLPRIGSLLGASSILVTNLLPHTEEMKEEILYDSSMEIPKCVGWPVRIGDSWKTWGTMSYPEMHWGANRYCRFVGDRSLVIGWDGGVSPCYALMHSYKYYIFDRCKNVSRYTIGNIREQELAELWNCEEYVRFRDKVSRYAFPSCVDCGINCGYTDINQDCWGSDPSCADCLYAQGIIRCP